MELVMSSLNDGTFENMVNSNIPISDIVSDILLSVLDQTKKIDVCSLNRT